MSSNNIFLPRDTPNNHWTELLNKTFSELRHKNEDVRAKAAKTLYALVAAQAREMGSDQFPKFMGEIHKRISDSINTGGLPERSGAIMAIDELIDIDYDENENANKITKFGLYIRQALNSSEMQVLVMSARALGRLVRTGGTTLTAETVDGELKRALEWLGQTERYEPHRYAAVLILRELALNAPTLFNLHVGDFVALIWNALNDISLGIREAAVEALRACLDVVAERQNTVNVSEWYRRLYQEAQKSLRDPKQIKESDPKIHGSLLAIGELLVNTGDFMEAYFKEVCEAVMKFKDSRLVKKTVINILPRLAALSPEAFSKDYLNSCIVYLTATIKSKDDKTRAYIALGEIAVAVKGNIKPYLDSLVGLIRMGLQTKKKGEFSNEALTCLSMVAVAVGPALRSYMQEVLPEMLNGGLSEHLTESMAVLGQHIPAIMPDIQELLLHFVGSLLGHKFAEDGKDKDNRLRRSVSISSLQINQELSKNEKSEDAEVIALALRTLGSFKFTTNTNVRSFDLIIRDLLQNCIINYISNDNPIIRKEAALTSSALLVATNAARGGSSLFSDVLDKLLILGISDRDDSIRRAVMAALDKKFDQLLAQPENLSSLFLALNDEVFEVRELAITVIGRLTARNPAYVMPSLRKTLIQLLGDLEFSGDSRNKEESAKLLAHLIRSSHRLLAPYEDSILKTLLPKLREGDSHVASSVLMALGELSLAGGEHMTQHLSTLLPIIIEMLQDQSSTKRDIALRTLGQLASNLGYVILPFFDYPQLLDILLNELKTENNKSIRKEVIKVLGVLGSLDPYKYKSIRVKTGQEATGKAQSEESRTPPSSNERYYPTVAINALVKIMKDPSLTVHYHNAIESLTPILRTLGTKCAAFLPQIMPPFLQIMRNSETASRESLFQELSALVATAKYAIRDYLDEIFELVLSHWSSHILQIISLVEDISVELREEIKVYLPSLIPPMLKVLHTDTSQRRQATRKVLHALEAFETNLEDYLHLVIPAIVNLFEQDDPEMDIHKLAIQTLGRLCTHLDFTDYASRIIHPIVRLLDSPVEKTKDQAKVAALNDLRKEAFETLSALVYQLGTDYAIFIPMVNKVMIKQGISDTRYETLISRLMKNQPLQDEADRKLSDTDRQRRKSSEDRITDTPASILVSKLKVTVSNLQQAWTASQRSTKEDWVEWMRRFSVGLLRETPSTALRSCTALAQDYTPLVRELFNAAFISCWTELDEASQRDLVQNLEIALESPSTPPEILTTLLNLAEFMEHEEKPIQFGIKLGEKAEKCHAYAKALYYKEEEFLISPAITVEALISLNNQLGQPNAAIGILKYAQANHQVELKESWYEKLHNWEEALAAYEAKQKESKDVENLMGQIRSLHALGEWESLYKISDSTWDTAEDKLRSVIAPYATAAAWNCANWVGMEKFVDVIPETTVEGGFYRAILDIHSDNYSSALNYISQAREQLDTELSALIGESYSRAYTIMVRVQQLAELEEVIQYKQSADFTERRATIKKIWRDRLLGCQRDVDTWQKILAVRSLVLEPHEDMEMWLKYTGLCRKSSRMNLARKTLTTLLGNDPSKIPSAPIPTQHPPVAFAYIKHMWANHAQQPAFERLRTFAPAIKDNSLLQARAYQRLGEWQMVLEPLDEKNIPQIISHFQAATKYDTNWYKAWHSWALANFEVVAHYEKMNSPNKNQYVVPSVKGFFRSIDLSGAHSLQDTLRLLTLWFKYGNLKEVESALLEGFNTVSIDTWLQVIPQIIARIAAPSLSVRRLIQDLLSNIGRVHPQALVFPLTVALKSQSPQRIAAAETVIQTMRRKSSNLVDQALMVSNELVRVAILWNEMWHEGLEDASRFYFAEHNPEQAIQRLKPLHDMLEKGPETLHEASFLQNCGRDLQEAWEWITTYKKSGKVSDFDQAWDLYYNVFRYSKASLVFQESVTKVDLEYCSPQLLTAQDLELAVPGTYRSGEPVIQLASFNPVLEVLQTKQRPRKLTLNGSDGASYVFILKGHEDLRQDERAMQLFGLVNTLLSSEFETSRNNLNIQRYSVVPLAPNSGLIGWVPHCDTLHTVIRAYRESRKIPVNQEQRLLAQLSADFANLCVMQKVEIFKFLLASTDGMDLKKILWLQSQSAEAWFERRTNYTRSLATMSMVGYILGLGDRHCSNLMLERQTGKIIHIDFGDCFEVAMHREKFPEKVPFRLTRMLINAMGVSGIEGNFRSTCESVMRVLRENKESLMAVLEAFVHDPLISWRLLTPNTKDENDNKPKVISFDDTDAINTSMKRDGKAKIQEEADNEIPEVLNEKAISIIERISNKLTGRDFSPRQTLDVQQQVHRLIKQATDVENLSQAYLGWSAYW